MPMTEKQKQKALKPTFIASVSGIQATFSGLDKASQITEKIERKTFGSVARKAAAKGMGKTVLKHAASKAGPAALIASAAFDVGRMAHHGTIAAMAYGHKKRSEKHTKQKYGSVGAAMRTRWAKQTKKGP